MQHNGTTSFARRGLADRQASRTVPPFAPLACSALRAPYALAPRAPAAPVVPFAAAAALEVSAAGAAPALALPAALHDAARKALGGGMAGAVAMTANVGALMWMRTIIQFQYRYGMGTREAMRHLYAEGGVRRFYRGVSAAPLARFGDTAANAGTLVLLDDLEATRGAPVWLKTGAASVAAASFRMLLMPLDACKTVMQVEGAAGLSLLRNKMAASGPSVLWAGSLGSASATMAGHFPWFLTYNELNAMLPTYDRKTELPAYLLRSGGIGFCATVVSDTVSNSLRVLKTTKQASAVAISYRQAAQLVVEKDGVQGLFLRGLKTKIMANGVQGFLFSVLWRLGQDALAARQ